MSLEYDFELLFNSLNQFENYFNQQIEKEQKIEPKKEQKKIEIGVFLGKNKDEVLVDYWSPTIDPKFFLKSNSCEKCKRSYSTKGNLQRHMKTC